MFYKPNFDVVKRRYAEYWALENHQRPLLWVTAPKERPKTAAGSPILARHATLRDRWLDTEYMLAAARATFDRTYYGADALPVLNPNLGPDLFASLYGVPLVFGQDTSWSEHTLTEWDEYVPFCLDREHPYYKKIVEMTIAASEDGKDAYLVGVTDIHAGLDCLAAFRGPENLCIDTLESPDFIRRGAMDLFSGFTELYRELAAITRRHQEGKVNWMGIWHPGGWYVTSCDFICMISPDMFDDLVAEELNAELDFLDASIFHLDGPDALRHLDRLLELPTLHGIQWVYGAGQPTASHWIGVLRRIQAAGKAFQVAATPAELPFLLENLKPEGAMYVVEARTEAEARALEALLP
ncbi:MAG: trimethylamine corrinoid protein 2 [Clostridiales bacterium]|jgi:hypothetical protein|nr:trimethylamine corrinoid protein 2 [Clostridiales bacterium]